ncbi:putative zinc-binding protein [Bradyrhizobium sp. CCBAU 53338]|uniref:putative zinc-binding protein n=1 Tax=Bradyrhizobium sp. CCBAU 53338 TaxID=1325111 RepID=UPI00188A4B69|nr:putative zinc-binding protein [Bradyrhizobium sp. CCBAU 53338]QOZ55389.1 zinc-binding protein [Bradyrhizobium sp. CCBAU 53338]
MKSKSELPLVYSCSGCSSAAQMANDVALRLDHDEEAEMSCIAGVGGDVGPLVRIAKSGRPILAIDGCSLRCAAHCLARHGVKPTTHLVLTDVGIKKRFHKEFDESEATLVYRRAVAELKSIKANPPADGLTSSSEMVDV